MLPFGKTGSGESVTESERSTCGESKFVVTLMLLLPLFGSMVVPEVKKFEVNEPSGKLRRLAGAFATTVNVAVVPLGNEGFVHERLLPRLKQVKPAGPLAETKLNAPSRLPFRPPFTAGSGPLFLT